MMKGLVVTTEKTMRVQEFPEPTYKSIGDAVGGYFEVVRPVRMKRPYWRGWRPSKPRAALWINPLQQPLHGWPGKPCSRSR